MRGSTVALKSVLYWEGPNCITQTEAYLTLEGAVQSSNNHSLAHVSHLLTKFNNK